MAAALSIPFITVDTYLHTFDSEPDMDYVDGILEERNLGEVDHSDLQSHLCALFLTHRRDWAVRAFVEVRVQVAPSRYRIPDVCVLPSSWERTKIIRQAPLLCIEVKSPSFTLARERERAADYLAMGVPEVWIFDPEKRVAYVLTATSFVEHREGRLHLADTKIEVHLAELFAALDF